MSPYADEVAKVVVEEGVQVVTTGAGNPGKYMEMWKDAGIVVIPVVASVALAKLMERGGADAVVAEGTESGGHIGEADHHDPGSPGGGCGQHSGDRRRRHRRRTRHRGGLHAGSGGGSDGNAVRGGKGSPSSMKIIRSGSSRAKDIDSAVTGRSHGHPVRCLRNQMTRQYVKLEEEGKSFEELEYLTLGGLRKAVMDGDVTDGVVMAGQIAGMVKKEQTCKEMIEEMMEQAEKLLAQIKAGEQMGKTAFIFPGQGAQVCGMGKDFYEHTETGRKIFDQASELLGFSMPELCFEKNDRLDITEYTQAAMVTVSVAMLKVMEEQGFRPDVTAGLSLGEYCALAASGVMTPEDAILTVRRRGILMQEAVPAGIGGMSAVLGMNAEAIDQIVDPMDGVQVANYNCPGQIVISGRLEAVAAGRRAVKGGRSQKSPAVKRQRPLPFRAP